MTGRTVAAAAAVVAALAVATGLSLPTCFWSWLAGHESPGATVRNITLVVAGLIAIPLTLWRVMIADRQANVAHQGLLQDRYQKGAEMLGSPSLSARLGGIYALASLGRQHPDPYRSQVIRLLCAFVRHPTEDGDAQRTATPGRSIPLLREDVQAAATAVTARDDDGGLRGDGSDPIDFRGATLRGADLASANLSGADLRTADMEGAYCCSTDLRGAQMTSSYLRGANLYGADLAGADLNSADMSNIIGQRAGFSGAKLLGVKLSGATLERADFSNSWISTADLAGAGLQDADLSGASFGAGTRVVASDPPVTETITAVVTQTQLDEARADPANPPKFHPACTDPGTGAQLVWRGKVLSELPGCCGPAPPLAYPAQPSTPSEPPLTVHGPRSVNGGVRQ